MSAKILDGKIIANDLQTQLKKKIESHRSQGRRAPELAVILLGDNPASTLYVQNKHRACGKIGIISHQYALNSNTQEKDLLKLIKELNVNPTIDGILIQLPLPEHINTSVIIEAIDPSKDVDGFHPYNLGLLAQKRPFLRPCTPFGIMKLLEHTQLTLKGLEATVIGVSNIVGRPMVLELLMAGCTVTACHRYTHDLKNHVNHADVLVCATGNPHLIPGDWIKPGSCVIDVGINRLPNGHFVGDVDFISAKEKAGWITPVPGGVGPMTVASLLKNCLIAYEHRLKCNML